MFAVRCLDKSSAAPVRADNRPAHLGYIKSSGSVIAAAGPLISAEGRAIGGLFLLDVADLAAANDWALNDPFRALGVYESVEVHEWNYLLGQGLQAKA